MAMSRNQMDSVPVRAGIRPGTKPAVRLIRRYLQWARSLGAKIICAGVSTGVHVEQTARLYEAMGMTRYGVLLEA